MIYVIERLTTAGEWNPADFANTEYIAKDIATALQLKYPNNKHRVTPYEPSADALNQRIVELEARLATFTAAGQIIEEHIKDISGL